MSPAAIDIIDRRTVSFASVRGIDPDRFMYSKLPTIGSERYCHLLNPIASDPQIH